ncbi:MAG: peptidoglycan DD-metalloendopeptidase family protein [Anaerolineales bacterium]|nr:peptidoglycan DD-metalloendopeptidase family protein [Anaerolineales bacterium]
MKSKGWLLILLVLFSACSLPSASEAEPTPVIFEQESDSPPPASAPSAAPQPTPVCPNLDCLVVAPAPPPVEALRFDLPTPGAEPISAWRPPLYPVPWALNAYDHFYFTRPIGADEVNWPLANYRYGGVFFEDITHTGVDIPAAPGTSVLAAGPGMVVWAGWGQFSGDPKNEKDAYGQSVTIRHEFGYNGATLYTLYAHMRQVDVAVGQWVDTGQYLGEVGDTGYTTGPHLHFEVRIGENSYFQTRNPELWIAPPQGWGVLAGRVMDSNRELFNRKSILIESLQTGRQWTVITYGPDAIRPDPYYNENFVISDLPTGRYNVYIVFDGKSRRQELEIRPGQVTFFAFRGEYGYNLDLPPAPGMENIFTPTPTPKK